MFGEAKAGNPELHENLKKCGKWWAQQDSNLRPRDYESPALTN